MLHGSAQRDLDRSGVLLGHRDHARNGSLGEALEIALHVFQKGDLAAVLVDVERETVVLALAVLRTLLLGFELDGKPVYGVGERGGCRLSLRDLLGVAVEHFKELAGLRRLFVAVFLERFDTARQLVDAAVGGHVNDARVGGLRGQHRQLGGQLLQDVAALARMHIDEVQPLADLGVLLLSGDDPVVERVDLRLLFGDALFVLAGVLFRLLDLVFDAPDIFIVVQDVVLGNGSEGVLLGDLGVNRSDLRTDRL